MAVSAGQSVEVDEFKFWLSEAEAQSRHRGFELDTFA
jgi:hypothetical protein